MDRHNEPTTGEGLVILLADHASVDWLECYPEGYDPEIGDGVEVPPDALAGYFKMCEMHGNSLVQLVLRSGMSSTFCAKLLRDAADLVEQHGTQLLNLPNGAQGFIHPGGEIVMGQSFGPDVDS
ncbi:MAG: hypothetical protein NTY19_03630 [Planctomycetota bacterium]|nr:hypothetical protein [Planctomycetota bacterium]